MLLDIHSIYSFIFTIWRKRRHQLFLDVLQPKSNQTMIDIGGRPQFWTRYPQPVERIDAINVEELKWDAESAPDHHIRLFEGDGCKLDFADNSYSIAFSNSVIEHVGTWEQQCQFASEIRRVGNAVWVQTPAYECVLEPHYMAPFIHYLPQGLQFFVAKWLTPWGWLEHPSDDQIRNVVETTRLLRKSEMKELFPDCEILTERLLVVFPKSYIAVRRFSEQKSGPAESTAAQEAKPSELACGTVDAK